MKTLTIDRSKWRTGGDFDPSSPRDSHPKVKTHGHTALISKKTGYMCCLGFYCKDISGISSDVLLGHGTPNDIGETYYEKISELLYLNEENGFYDNNIFTDEAISINDNPGISDEEREEKIKEHFKKIDVNVEFINEYNS
jgi:hypothetical protein